MSDATRKPEPPYPPFFGELSTRLGDVRRANRRRYLQFFAELSPRLDTAKALELELDRQLARRFNVFDYLSTSEVGLSSIIADLLNPQARHGQGTLFLRTLLDELAEVSHRPRLDANFSKRITVVTERVITNSRRLDISVEIPGSNGAYCLAIENKPYADDERNQVMDYLTFLQKEYSDRFLLIYLSPTGQGPSKWSFPCRKLDRWEGRLGIMAYWGETNGIASEEQAAEDRFDGFRVGLSLATWFSACRRRCEPDRLRWFLSEAEVFCRHQFGGLSRWQLTVKHGRYKTISSPTRVICGRRRRSRMDGLESRRSCVVIFWSTFARRSAAGQRIWPVSLRISVWNARMVEKGDGPASCAYIVQAGLSGRPNRSILHARDARPSPCSLDRQAQTVGIGACSTRWKRAP